MAASKNDATSFRPYNPGEIVGSTSPGLPYIPPAAGCPAFAIILTSAILFIVAPYLIPVIQSVGAVVGAVIVGASTFAANAIATAAGSALGQNTFSWKASLKEGVIAGLTFGLGKLDILAKLGSIGKVIQSTSFTRIAAQAVLNKAIDITASKVVGLPSSFSWKAIAIESVTNTLAEPIVTKLSDTFVSKITDIGTREFTGNLIGGIVTQAIKVGVSEAMGVKAQFNFGQIAGNAFAASLNPNFQSMKTASDLKGEAANDDELAALVAKYGPEIMRTSPKLVSNGNMAVGSSSASNAANEVKTLETIQVTGSLDNLFVWDPSKMKWAYGNSIVLDIASGKISQSTSLAGYRKDGYNNQQSSFHGKHGRAGGAPVQENLKLVGPKQMGPMKDGYAPAEEISGFDPATNRRASFNGYTKDTASGRYARSVFNTQDLIATRNSKPFSGELGVNLGESYNYLFAPQSVGRLIEVGVGENHIGFGTKALAQSVYGGGAEYTYGEGVTASIGAAVEAKATYVEGGAKGVLGSIDAEAGSSAKASARVQVGAKIINGRINADIGGNFGAEAVALSGTVHYQAPTFDLGLVEIQPGVVLQGNLGGIGGKLEGGIYTLKNSTGIKIYTGAGITPGIGGNIRGDTTIQIAPRVFDTFKYFQDLWTK